MKTNIPFLMKSGEKSNCGDPLDISLSSHHLNWDGVLVEKGTSPYFYPKDVVTPNFYFAMELKVTYHWLLETKDGTVPSITEPGDIWINPPNTPFTHNIDVPCNFLIINISEEKMVKSFDGILPKGLVFLNNYNIQDTTLQNLMTILLNEVETGGHNGTWLVDKIINVFSNYFIRHFSNYYDLLNKKQEASILDENDFNKVNNYIHNHLSEGITIDDLADELNISKFHFLNEFKKLTGITPYQHLLKVRIDLAKKALSNLDKSITSIAYDLGFSDNSHFSRTFKKATGDSPKNYREKKSR
ncbi:helix-turn-helix transcriptional regulator [Acidaminobacter sp. JC074]|uniref:helix-turn-helix domain-containing protein n=1 Tax=Acidaminobacter sp. JC074 TaxID=2530199 RepID=UPI001F0CDF49|nr:AraC family transcriptional regulator [Acidaminobacter sp. JC074]MCH4889221.1 helix-turn-helix transcriptional regulator [Acidaminobacter sp. JC074]